MATTTENNQSLNNETYMTTVKTATNVMTTTTTTATLTTTTTLTIPQIIKTNNELTKSNMKCNNNENQQQQQQQQHFEYNEKCQQKNGDIIRTKMLTTKQSKTNYDRTLSDDINKLLKEMPLTDDTTCGFWIFKGSFLQRFANQTSYVILYGIVGCIFSMTYSYFNGTITTIEKRFKIPSRNSGIISVGNDISSMLISAVISYYAGRGHRPRWIGFGISTIVIFCLLMAVPHFLYGPGDDALQMTEEYGAIPDENATLEVIEAQRSKTLCHLNDNGNECEQGDGNLAPQIILFVAQFISGIGGSLYYTLGVAYMDDNTKKSKTPALLSLSYFLRMLGPAIGLALASFCLRFYIAPNLKAVITMKDPRWLGAWWLGWIIIGFMIFFWGILLTMFPKQLPRAKARSLIMEQRKRQLIIEKELQLDCKMKQHLNEKKLLLINNEEVGQQLQQQQQIETKASFNDMLKTFKRLITNKTLMYNNFSSIFYLFGYTPYWIFTPKYIEIQFRQSAATSNLVIGTVALAFSAIGVLLSGVIISRYRPKARHMAAWNVIVGGVTVFGTLSYAFIGCPGNEQSIIVNMPEINITTCNSDCHCDYVRYSPICGENQMTYISACHAGCKTQHITSSGQKYYENCSCITANKRMLQESLPKNVDDKEKSYVLSLNFNDTFDSDMTMFTKNELLASNIKDDDHDEHNHDDDDDDDDNDELYGGYAISGPCAVNCSKQFITFLIVMCILKFIGATGRASNFLVTVRCVPEKDKTAAMGFGMMLMSSLAFIPSPIFFGWVLDRLCLVWGKTCTNKGNCWLYDAESLRFTLNTIASLFMIVGVLFDCGVWYYVKDLKIFDDEIKEIEMEIVKHSEEINSEKKVEV